MKTLIRAAIVLTLCAQTAFAAEPPTKPKEGFGVFLVMFRVSPGAAARAQGPLDVTRYGGVEHERRGDVLVVTLPLEAWAIVEAHPQVAYVQRVWMGEPLDKWSEGRRPRRQLRAASQRDAGADGAIAAASWDSDVYSYDGVGNITAIGNDQFAYDSAGRIIESSVDGLAEHYGYDSFGNLTSKTTGARPSPIPPVDPGSNRLIGYSSDVAGNITSLPGASGTWEYPSHYEYDAVGMPVVVQGHSVRDARRMIYTADDERIALTVAGESRISIRGFDKKVLREFFGDFLSGWWAWSQDYVWAGGALLAGERETSNGGRLAFHLDHLGSVRLITKEDKTQVSAHRYLPFGVERTDSTAELKNFDFGQSAERITPFRIEPMKFTSHERDFNGVLNVDGTDHLDYMHARFYAPAFGRFLSVDPALDLKAAIKSPQTWNRYAYVHNDPVNKIDPDGRLAYHWHYWITYKAARKSGMSRRDSASLAWMVVKVDHRRGSQSTDAWASNVHAMRGKKDDGGMQTVKEGRGGTEASIAGSLYFSDLAGAIHTAQDRAAPRHADKVWNGAGRNLETLAHGIADAAPDLLTIGTAYVNTLNVLKASREGNLLPVVYSGADEDEP